MRELSKRALARLGAIELSPRTRRILRLVGYPAFGFFVALVSFSASIPRDKLREQLQAMLSADPSVAAPLGLGMDVTAGDLELSLLGRKIIAQNVVLRTRPLRHGDKPARFVLDTVKVGVGVFGALLQRPAYAFDVDAFGGTVEGVIATTTKDVRYTIAADDVKLGDVQALQSGIGGLPIDGTLDGKLELFAPDRRMNLANGSLELDVDGVSLGDGKAKLTIPGDPMLSLGVTIPRIRLGKVVANLAVEKGRARIDTIRAHSPDVDLTVEGYIELNDVLTLSQLHLFVRLKISDDLVKREPTLALVTGALAPGKRGDGFFGAQLVGALSSPSFVASRNPPQGVTSKFESTAPAAAPKLPEPSAPKPSEPAATTPPPSPSPGAAMLPATPLPPPDMATPPLPPPADPALLMPGQPATRTFRPPGVQGPPPGIAPDHAAGEETTPPGE